MNKQDFAQFAQEIIAKTEFKNAEEIYSAGYYDTKNQRNVIFRGEYLGKKAVLKIYDDPRVTNEPESLTQFHSQNKSSMLKAPELYASEVISPQRGWLIMQYLESGYFFKSPLSKDQRQEFIKVFFEYRKNFPREAQRPLTFAEHLNPGEYCVYSMNRWLEISGQRRAQALLEEKEYVIDPKDFMPRYSRTIKVLLEGYKNRSMVWCHGHVKPKEIFYSEDEEKYYLTDFAHAHMYPEGYELAFIVWADWLLGAEWKMEYDEWKQGIDEWLELLIPVANELNYSDPKGLLQIALLERAMGATLVDVPGSDRGTEEKIALREKLYRLIDEILNCA